jgi:alkanesulfonate monooxygenase SsuD/methylene tetrahydromethanopterin reductase-like flavin-dependent oxidoreductase (luciferase family)
MKFGLFFELAVPKTESGEFTEERVVHEAIEQCELADKLGYSTAWAVEHHFLDEYSHCSAPEVFLTAVAARTKNMRIGHGIAALPPPMNHPARMAERIGMMDIISHGRLEYGTGETTSTVELEGFGIDRTLKREMWEEAVGAIQRMLVETPFRGIDGKYIKMPPRNVIPKPVQTPHPPFWVACSRRDTALLAARKGLGALTFAFLDANESRQWVDSYYKTLAEECHPTTPTVNPNLGVLMNMHCSENEQEAIDRSIDGLQFFYYSAAHYFVFGQDRPGRTRVWEEFLEEREDLGLPARMEATGQPIATSMSDKPIEDALGVFRDETKSPKEMFAQANRSSPNLRGAVGTPKQLRDLLRTYEDTGIDQMLFAVQAGNIQHEDICETLELFATKVMPEFHERDQEYQAAKARRLEPVIERALDRYAPDDRTVPDDYIVLAATQ